MITAICLNPCIDKTVTVDGVRLGEHNRVIDNQVHPAGKGVNVAVVLKRLREDVRLLGFNYTDNGNVLQQYLDDEQVECRFVWVNGEVRTNIKLHDISNDSITELNETGGFVNQDKLRELFDELNACAADTDMYVISGSLPLGCDEDIYKTIVKNAPHRCIVDCAGEYFAMAVEAAPFMVKPNRYELEGYIGRRLEGINDCVDAARMLIEKGIKVVCVSLGDEGAVITDGTVAYYAPAVNVRVNSSVGAGDSLVAGFCKGMLEGRDLEGCFKMGIAAATACVMSSGTGLLDEDSFNLMLARVQIKEIEL